MQQLNTYNFHKRCQKINTHQQTTQYYPQSIEYLTHNFNKSVTYINDSFIAYLIKDPKTQTLLMAGSSIQIVNQILRQKSNDIKEIESQAQSKLKYIFVNDSLKSTKSEFAPTQRNEQVITAQKQGDLRPLVIGDHSVCFIDAKGYKTPFSLIAFTHLTSTSTKIPILFPGTLIKPWYYSLTIYSSIDYQNDKVKPKDYISSLDKIKFFPNQAYIFPSSTVSEEDLLFAKALTQNPFVDEKIKLFHQNKKFGDALIPTTVLEEKMMNPFLITEKFKDLLGTSDKEKAFLLLRKMRQQFKI